MLRHGGLADAELVLHHTPDLARGDLAAREQLHDPTSDRIPEDVERVHAAILHSRCYKVNPELSVFSIAWDREVADDGCCRASATSSMRSRG